MNLVGRIMISLFLLDKRVKRLIVFAIDLWSVALACGFAFYLRTGELVWFDHVNFSLSVALLVFVPIMALCL